VALVTPVLGLCRSYRGQPTFGETAVGGLSSSSPGSGSPWWNRQPAAGAAGPSDGAGLLVLKPRGLLGCQPAYCLARGTPYKSSPRHFPRWEKLALCVVGGMWAHSDDFHMDFTYMNG
jgi:hypothetical protein